MTHRRFTAPCTIRVKHTWETLEAHVELAGGAKPDIGDRVLVHGDAVQVPFGECLTIKRQATIIRASTLQKLWIKLKAHFELTELYEVSFSPGRLK